jgi:transcriptional regulator with PAS, ATPase and Fis domain
MSRSGDTTQQPTMESTGEVLLFPRPRLLWSPGAGVVSKPPHSLQVGANLIGRGVREGICLPDDPRVSRHHATIHVGPLGRTLRIADAGSSNGTFVNGRRVGECALMNGDLVRIGDSFLLLRCEEAAPADAPIASLIGTAPAIRAMRHAIQRIAPSLVTVLLLGESGTGKEVAAQAIHQASRPGRPFVPVNCSAIPEGLAESQLFGHEAGAFTGARRHPGLFRMAHGGTLFLDEIGELPLAVQPKLLRVLEDRTIWPVGATEPSRCDVRVVAATNRDLAQAVQAATFRGDLYARLTEITLRLPPLRERREDILPLLQDALGPEPPRLSPRLVQALLLHGWPYNVRELLKLAAQLRICGSGQPVLDLDLVADRLPEPPGGAEAAAPATAPPPRPRHAPRRDEQIALLQAHDGSITSVAQATGSSRFQVYRWLRHHQIDARSFRGDRNG